MSEFKKESSPQEGETEQSQEGSLNLRDGHLHVAVHQPSAGVDDDICGFPAEVSIKK